MLFRRTEDTDANLVAAVRSGKTQRFSELVSRYRNLVYATVLARVHDPDDADDLAQDTFLAGFRQLDQLEDPRKFGPWLRRIAENGALHVAEKQHLPLLRGQAVDGCPDQGAALGAFELLVGGGNGRTRLGLATLPNLAVPEVEPEDPDSKTPPRSPEVRAIEFLKNSIPEVPGAVVDVHHQMGGRRRIGISRFRGADVNRDGRLPRSPRRPPSCPERPPGPTTMSGAPSPFRSPTPVRITESQCCAWRNWPRAQDDAFEFSPSGDPTCPPAAKYPNGFARQNAPCDLSSIYTTCVLSICYVSFRVYRCDGLSP